MKEEKKVAQPAGRWKFLLLMLAVYPVVGFLNPDLAGQALAGFKSMVMKVIPILGLVFIALFAVNLLLNPERIKKHLGRDSGIMGWFYAVIGGILISGPPYVLYPMLGEFKRLGVRNSLIAVYLYNRNVKIPFLPVMAYYFGLRYTVVVSVLIILFSLLNGLLVGRLTE
ncbi:MAG: hypothetical protein RQ753_05990 [Desulfurivibrionaceae bacterium]|nr:hypothetical protein [Desulfobulbales bacterium]MDT8335226.1 hypothetical protein [Desulfurivibrionaceae bacterium]